jgi:LacI family transcriptional regulator
VAARAAGPRRRAVQRVTMADVATLAGVSEMTVSRALSGRAPVSDATRRKVADAVGQLGFRPNVAARHLASGGTHRVGVLYANPSQAYLGELLLGALDEAAARGLQLSVARASAPAARLRDLAALLDSGVDAFVLPPSVCDATAVQRLLRRRGAVWVAITPADPAQHPLSVLADDVEAARAMTAHLVALGHKRIGFIRGDPAYGASAARQRGYLQALEAAGLAPGPIEQGFFSFASGVAAAERLLARTPHCTAIFASNDDMAAGALALAHRLSLDVPRTLTVVGFDDTPISSIVAPAITTVRQPISEMARAAVRLLAGALQTRAKGEEVERRQELFHCPLVERESSAPPAGRRVNAS